MSENQLNNSSNLETCSKCGFVWDGCAQCPCWVDGTDWYLPKQTNTSTKNGVSILYKPETLDSDTLITTNTQTEVEQNSEESKETSNTVWILHCSKCENKFSVFSDAIQCKCGEKLQHCVFCKGAKPFVHNCKPS